MNSLKLALNKQPIVYIARDLERALGLPEIYENYHIITNATPFAKQVAETRSQNFQNNQKIFLVEADRLLDTHELLSHPKSTEFLKNLKNPALLVFKNTSVIEKMCRDLGYQLLNPSARLSQTIEEKISQLDWLGDLTRFLPPHRFATLEELTFGDVQQKILQFNRAHTGNGTVHLTDEQVFLDLQQKFPHRPVRVTDFIEGPMFTNNNAVWGAEVLCGPINYQITGLLPFTDRPFATIGNDWALPHKLLSPKLREDYAVMATAIGKQLAHDGWKGLFGIDVVLDQKKQKLYLIEINARQPASTTYESQLQQTVSPNDPDFITTFEAHLASLLDLANEDEKIIPLADGAQIIQRVRDAYDPPPGTAMATLKDCGFKLTPYQNFKPGDDLLRIQSRRGLLSDHKIFNEIGDVISTELTPYPQALQEIALGFRPDKTKLWTLERPVIILPLAEFHWELTLPFWEKEGTDDWNLTPHEVLEHPDREPTHSRRIAEADLSFPIIAMRQADRWRILDGLHRLCKAHLAGLTEISVKIITKEDIPLIRQQFN